MRRVVAAAAGLMLGGCALSATGSDACEAAAWAQAAAEQRWGQAIEAHEAAHEAADERGRELDNAGHDASTEAIAAARVEMILAEADTRRQCG